jgi:hypothetical protein
VYLALVAAPILSGRPEASRGREEEDKSLATAAAPV